MKVPIIMDHNETTLSIIKALEKTVEKYSLPPTQLGCYGFLDANYNARPASIIREGLAFARAQNIERIDQEIVSKIYREYFEWNIKWVYEIWVDLLSPEKGISPSLRVKFRDIARVIRRYDEGNGVSLDIILQEINEPEYKVEKKIREMLEKAVIYEVQSGRYKLVPEV